MEQLARFNGFILTEFIDILLLRLFEGNVIDGHVTLGSV